MQLNSHRELTHNLPINHRSSAQRLFQLSQTTPLQVSINRIWLSINPCGRTAEQHVLNWYRRSPRATVTCSRRFRTVDSRLWTALSMFTTSGTDNWYSGYDNNCLFNQLGMMTPVLANKASLTPWRVELQELWRFLQFETPLCVNTGFLR